MKKIKLVLEILRLVWSYFKVYPLRNCLVKERMPGGETHHRFVRDERVDTVFVFGPRERIKEGVIQKAFPNARIEFQCFDSVPAAPHRLVNETVGYLKGQTIVLINPWDAEDAEYLGKKGLMGFDAPQLLGLYDGLINECKHRILLASYENGEIRPEQSYFRELMGPESIPFHIKCRLKELFDVRMPKSVRLISILKEEMS